MDEPPDTPFIVPQGKIVDFIDGKLRNDTPEEYVRQEIEKSLVREYQYGRDNVAVEYRVKLGHTSKRADLAVFPDGSKHEQQQAWAIIECKSPKISSNHKQHGIDQLKSYMAACVNAEFGMWTNGHERFCFRKTHADGRAQFVDIADFPEKGKSLDEAERPKFHELRSATSDALLFTFRRCHNYIAGNQGLQKPEAFWELLKLIFCKIEDERSDEISFYATSSEMKGLNGRLKVRDRIANLFAHVQRKYGTIFNPNEVIELEPRVLAYIVSQLQTWSLLESDIDVKGKAYEEIVGSNLRGDRGEFFTPRNICGMAVAMLDPGPDDLVLDPACGTGGFLTIAMNHVIRKLRERAELRWRVPENPSDSESREYHQKIRDYADQRIVGIDLNPNLVKASKMNMVMNNDGAGGLYQANSLAASVTWGSDLRSRDLEDSVDLLFTNPPFGSKIKIDDPAILERYDLAYTWDFDADNDRYYIREPRQLQRSQPPEILFVERCVRFLKPGTGRLAIVLPDGILGSPGLAYVREWLFEQTRVLASIDLHPDAF
ncbi:MAG: type I restriction enzyme HsdR N-terminal domain-containing protein [Chloroflexi bacterium]|nr:type I restriction enzyme HsdR N-terminal domain-containing protein [Chloroflexota bacterium]